jgi:hypothetical protein
LDHLIGNSDRHTGNLFIGVNHDNSPSMIGIDHGFSFPNNNDTYQHNDFGNQREMFRSLEYNKLTPEFKNNLKT